MISMLLPFGTGTYWSNSYIYRAPVLVHIRDAHAVVFIATLQNEIEDRAKTTMPMSVNYGIIHIIR